MRDIKYRQPLKGGGFHYWGYVQERGGFVGPMGENDASGPSQQCTYIKDKDHKDIYESDVMRLQTGDMVSGEPMPHEVGTITWIDGRFVFVRHGDYDMPILEMNECLIAGMFDGDIIENPELLKQKQPATA